VRNLNKKGAIVLQQQKRRTYSKKHASIYCT